MDVRRVIRTGVVGVVWACLWACFGAKASLALDPWFPMGPFGGDARSITPDPANPEHLYLGTETGWIFTSDNGGRDWKRLAHVGKTDNLVIDHISIDPRNVKRMVVGAWIIDHPDGGVFISDDGGKTFYEQAQMHGQSVRSMARSVSNPDFIVAGTLQGVYASNDNGAHWHMLSPEGSSEIHEVQSIAIDPKNPQRIFAGTWHLPWKTFDGGEHWLPIRGATDGIIEDSDVFSIIIDPGDPKVVYASACSGIYKSVNGGDKFKRLNGTVIPKSAIRTRKLAQDPKHSDTVFAGTTDGLYRTIDGGAGWQEMTQPGMVVNDIYVDPANPSQVLLATERTGVLRSIDGGVSFEPANTGFSTRQISSYLADPHTRSTLYVGIVNDRQTGGVYQSLDGGVRWQQQSLGLDGRDVFSLGSAQDGTLLAGTSHGVFRLVAGQWVDSNTMAAAASAHAAASAKPKATTPVRRGAHPVKSAPAPAVEAPAVPSSRRLDGIVFTLTPGADEILAATEEGLMRGTPNGDLWRAIPSLQMPETRFVSVQKSTVLVASLRRLMLSMDDGKTWDAVGLPNDMTQISGIAVDELNNLWVGGPEGIYFSSDFGASWKTLPGLYVNRINGVFFDASNHRVLVTSASTTFVFGAHLPDYKVTYWDSGWTLRFVRPVGDHLIGATMFDGMVLQPRWVDTPFKDDKTTAQK